MHPFCPKMISHSIFHTCILVKLKCLWNWNAAGNWWSVSSVPYYDQSTHNVACLLQAAFANPCTTPSGSYVHGHIGLFSRTLLQSISKASKLRNSHHYSEQILLSVTQGVRMWYSYCVVSIIRLMVYMKYFRDFRSHIACTMLTSASVWNTEITQV